jgi:hypothetical protein
MGRVLRLGCLGFLGFLGFLVLIAIVTPSPQQPAGAPRSGDPPATRAARATPTLPTVGDTVGRGGWEVTVTAFGPYEQFERRPVSPPPQGRLVVVEFVARNLQNRTSNFTTHDFTLVSGDGRRFSPAGQTASIAKGFFISQTVQPGLATENRVVFDVDPAARNLIFEALGLRFRLPE